MSDYYEKKYWDRERDKPRTGKIVWTGIGVILLLGVILTVLGFLLGWFNKGAQIVSPKNVEEQYGRVITTWEALKTSATNACVAQDSGVSENSAQLVEDPAFAYAATYRNLVVDYNARMKNVFEAGLVGPSGYPDAVPQYDIGPDTDWCSISADLSAIK